MITLATLGGATEQEVFDQVAKHLLAQKKRSGVKDADWVVTCMYRNDEGLKCAAGCLIADDEYYKDIEGSSWDVLVDEDVVPTENCLELIVALQNIHDCEPVEEWCKALGTLAALHNLSTDVLGQNYGN
jgi:hypothetical protein